MRKVPYRKKVWLAGLYLALTMTMASGCGRRYETIPLKKTGSSEGKKTTGMETSAAELAITEAPSSGELQTTDKGGLVLPDVFPLELLFASGAGGWGTTITLNRDGSFEGHYEDVEMGSRGEEYPNGTVYDCRFEGKFGSITQVNDHTYRMILEDLTLEKERGEEWIENQVRYIASAPNGLEQGHEFLFYTPGTAVAELDQEFVDWWHNAWLVREGKIDALDCYGLYHKEEGKGFFSYEP